MTDILGHDVNGRPLRAGDEVAVVDPRCDYDCCGSVKYPPAGTVGRVISKQDEYGEYDVVFDDFPHPSAIFGDPSWITHYSMVRKLDNHQPAGSFDEVMAGLKQPQGVAQ